MRKDVISTCLGLFLSWELLSRRRRWKNIKNKIKRREREERKLREILRPWTLRVEMNRWGKIRNRGGDRIGAKPASGKYDQRDRPVFTPTPERQHTQQIQKYIFALFPFLDSIVLMLDFNQSNSYCAIGSWPCSDIHASLARGHIFLFKFF